MGLKNYEARIVRGHIMKILKVAYPGPASVELIEVTMNDRSIPVSPSLVRGYLEYLTEKGYIKAWDEKDPILEIERTLVKLTAKGIDLMENTISSDPGVVL